MEFGINHVDSLEATCLLPGLEWCGAPTGGTTEPLPCPLKFYFFSSNFLSFSCIQITASFMKQDRTTSPSISVQNPVLSKENWFRKMF
jgi:hypothetical protein